MSLSDLQQTWENLAKTDPMWAVLTHAGKHRNRWNPEDFFATGTLEIDQLMEYVAALGIPLQHERALDFGCGIGRLTQALAQHFKQCYGIDIAPTMIKVAEEFNKMGNKCVYLHNDKTHLNLFEDDYFDLIYTNIVLQHMSTEFGFAYIQEFIRILKPGGLVIFKLPSEGTQWGKFKLGLKNSVPWLIRFYRFIRFGSGEIMETNYVPKQKMIDFLVANGAKVLDIVEFPARDHPSCRYCVTK